MDWFIRKDMAVGGPAAIKAAPKVGAMFGAAHVTLTTTGTQALALAIEAVTPRAPGNVIVPAWAPVPVWNAVRLAGHKPLFVDINSRTLGYDEDSLDLAINGDPIAIVFVHMLGERHGVKDALAFAVAAGIPLIEDMAQSHLMTPQLLGDIGITSFGSMKPISCGQGGAVFTNNHRIARLVAALAHQGVGYAGGAVRRSGQNARMSEATAKKLLNKLTMGDRGLRTWYQVSWKAVPAPLRLFPDSMYNVVAWTHQMVARLREADIPSRQQYRPAQLHPGFDSGRETQFNGAMRAWEDYLFLPFGPDMTEQDAEKIREALT